MEGEPIFHGGPVPEGFDPDPCFRCDREVKDEPFFLLGPDNKLGIEPGVYCLRCMGDLDPEGYGQLADTAE